MNKLASVLAALIITTTFTGCSDEKETNETTIKTDNFSNKTTQSISADKKAADDASKLKQNFVSNCVLGSGISDDNLLAQINEVCSCTYDRIVEKQGMNEFIRVEMEMRSGAAKTVPDNWNIDEVVAQCVTKLED